MSTETNSRYFDPFIEKPDYRYEIPTLPLRYPRMEVEIERDIIWDSEAALKSLTERFEQAEHREIIAELANVVKPASEARWQLGYMPTIIPTADGDTRLEFPTAKKASQNNRWRHQIEVARKLDYIAEELGMEERPRFIGVLAGLVHDSQHTFFSHVGERFFQKLAEDIATGRHNIPLEELNNLLQNHEQRLLQAVSDRNTPVGIFFSRRKPLKTTYEKQAFYNAIQQRGILGQIMNISDTVGYLDLDSAYFGYEPPHFESYISEAISLTRRGLKLNPDEESMAAMRSFLTYRNGMYMSQYHHPINMLLEEMQISAFSEIVSKNGSSDEVRKFIYKLMGRNTTDSDQDMLNLFRQKSLVMDVRNGSAFFGVPLEKFEVVPPDYEPNETDIVIPVDGYSSKKSLTLIAPTGNGTVTINGYELNSPPSRLPFSNDTRLAFSTDVRLVDSVSDLFLTLNDKTGERIERDFADEWLENAFGRDEGPNSRRRRLAISNALAVFSQDFGVKYPNTTHIFTQRA